MTRVSDVWRCDDDHVKVRFQDGTGSSVKCLQDEEAAALMQELGAALHNGGGADE